MSQWDRAGQLMSLLDWCISVKVDDYRQVAAATIGTAKIVTIWTGVASGFTRAGSPMIFETAVYDDGMLLRKRTYATEHDAHLGHLEECATMHDTKRVPHE